MCCVVENINLVIKARLRKKLHYKIVLRRIKSFLASELHFFGGAVFYENMK